MDDGKYNSPRIRRMLRIADDYLPKKIRHNPLIPVNPR
jgi:hypothetical protein